ncbi:MAG: hypothetical protein U5L09_09610 [Bacteroidales bacterium]|nr:hypothetical protein [Bacteroidales bacterium]
MFKKAFTRKRIMLLLVALFAVWMLFLDDFNMFRQLSLNSKIKEMEQQKEYYRQEIKSDSAMINTLNANLDSLEKYAREKYLMKKIMKIFFRR